MQLSKNSWFFPAFGFQVIVNTVFALINQVRILKNGRDSKRDGRIYPFYLQLK